MFYCEKCRLERHWPVALSRSYGQCEICGGAAYCYDRPCSSLPDPGPEHACSEVLQANTEIISLHAEIKALKERIEAERAISFGRAKLLLTAGDEIERLQRKLNEARVRADLTPEDDEDERTHGLGRV